MMDNTAGLGEAMERSAQRDKTKHLEERVARLEQRLVSAEQSIRQLIYYANQSNHK